MIEFNHIGSEALNLIVKSHLSQRPKFSNYFFANLDFVTYYETPNTLILRKAYDSFNRIYFLSSDSAELANCLSQLGTNDIINIPSKKGINEELELVLANGGYALYEKYERMYHNDIEARGKFDAELAKPSDIEEIYQILIGTFNPFSDTLPNRYE